MLSGAFGIIGFSWSACPVSTDLEIIMLDWLGKMLQLPQDFLFSSNGKGGGVIQGSASESTLLALICAREKAISSFQAIDKGWSRSMIMNKLVYYASTEAHSSVEKAGLLSGLTCHLLPTDAAFSLEGDVLQAAIDKDRTQGKIPFFYADSFILCPSKWMLVNYDCCAMWIKDREDIVKPCYITPAYLNEDVQEQTVDYRHISLAHEFENLVRNDHRFEIALPVVLGVVCFRLKGSDTQNEEMLRVIRERGNIALKSSRIRSLYIIRFVVCGKDTESEDILFAWREICLAANKILNSKDEADLREQF
ncbi:aromatic-L-amino-acid decarboxylase-like isoform X2 [Limulus polyphemus]|uniref:Aromatic-L-amino-acid decarboxylase-like isoform X2 n=1 Tax=Limulus polyphemus TaxID=6850 RepID=A0ABM1TIZ6_LIMPO|nr:aromatic-L-amino-acid decarboxylase-like isoform X2 [Limulus polyphemus]